MSNLFTCKEHYLAYRRAWSTAVNDDRAKSRLQENEYTWNGSRTISVERVPGWTTAAHMILNNILRSRPITRGFIPMHNKNRLMNGHSLNHGFYEAARTLRVKITGAQIALTKDEPGLPDWQVKSRQGYMQRTEVFLAPFDSTVSVEMLAKIEIPKIEPLDMWYNSELISEAITGKKFTMEEILPLMTPVDSGG